MKANISSNLPSYPSLRRVSLGKGFIPDIVRKIHAVSAFDILEKFEKASTLENYARVARGESGGHAGFPWHHGLICECIRGISDILVASYDERLDKKLDGMIALIAKAQDADPDGYINPYTTLMCPDKRWGRNGGSILHQHEIYNAGCLAEAGLHHYMATGKTALLRVAVKMTNYLADFIGDAPKHNVVPAHSLPEEAFLKLHILFKCDRELEKSMGANADEYYRLAKFMIDHRGDNETRYSYPRYLREYAQDHRPVREQREAVGHAVRATLLYTGMAAMANYDGEEGLITACRAIWKDISESKLHINGAVGAHKAREDFGIEYYLANHAYLETCAGVGLSFFGSEIFRMTEDARVWDTIETTLYNVIPASVSADGVRYSYVNPLESKGDLERWEWHSCPCCPPMLLKLIGLLPSLIFSERVNTVWLNLLIDSTLQRDDCSLTLDSNRLTVSTALDSVKLDLRIRIPYWTRGFSLKLNGEPVELTSDMGYAIISREFRSGDTLELIYDTPVVKYMAHPLVNNDIGLISVKRGPILYCAEGIDIKENATWEDLDITISDDSPLLLNDDGTISGKRVGGEGFNLIPYHYWNNRGRMPMRVWFRQKGHDAPLSEPDESWQGLLYRPYAEY